jgi:hypothetical protein
MWVIEENAIIDFSFVWFIPISAPVMAFIHGIVVYSGVIFIVNIMMDSGASFCQVDRIIHDSQDSDVITDGNHKWHGTIPSFKVRENRSRAIIIDLLKLIFDHVADDIIRSNLDLVTWVRKYFNIASDSWNLFELFISGINDIIFISRAIHVSNQLFLEIDIMDLVVMVVYINK